MPHLEVMLKALYNSTKFSFKLIIVESESTDGTAEFVDEYLASQTNVEVYHTKKEGLTSAINFGIKKAGKLDVYLTQDDVIHFPLYGRDWLMDMHDSSKEKGMGIVTGHSGGGISGPDYLPNLKWVGTWNAYIPRKALNKVGLFDKNMGPGDDIDFCYRLGKAGLCGRVIDYWVQHHRLTEHGSVDNEKRQKEMGDYFRKKHGIK